MKHLAALLFLTFIAVSANAAGDVTVLDGCDDGTGLAIPVMTDTTLSVLVRDTDAAGKPAVRYNPTLLQHLDPLSRLFFQAHACARIAAGQAGRMATVAEAQAADCLALKILLDAGALPRDQVDRLQQQLAFSDEEWQLLPGPRRGIGFAGCRLSGTVLRLPTATTPSAHQAEWNACARACGDRLWACQKRCRGAACGDACLEMHQACAAGCGARPE